MRKILFRAKALNYRPAQWIYGALLHYGNGAAVIIDDQLRYIDVDPDTIGQATGIDDIDGNPIFEGDIVVGIRQDRMQISAAVVWNPLEAGFGSIFRLDHSDIYPMVICPRVVGDIYTGHHLLSANPPMPLPGSEEIDPDVISHPTIFHSPSDNTHILCYYSTTYSVHATGPTSYAHEVLPT